MPVVCSEMTALSSVILFLLKERENNIAVINRRSLADDRSAERVVARKHDNFRVFLPFSRNDPVVAAVSCTRPRRGGSNSETPGALTPRLQTR